MNGQPHYERWEVISLFVLSLSKDLHTKVCKWILPRRPPPQVWLPGGGGFV